MYNKSARYLLPFVLLTGFFTAGTNAGISCNTFPWVGENWFYSKKHFISDKPIWQNFIENKLICQVNHRTIALAMTLLVSLINLRLFFIPQITKPARLSLVLLTGSLWMQLLIGMNVIWNNVPINLASMHQIGAMIVLSCILFSFHCCKRVDPR